MCGSAACARRMGARALISRRASATSSVVSDASACWEAPEGPRALSVVDAVCAHGVQAYDHMV